jgi:heme/copper-type cytochrome/quinol oxidase subunit 2
MKKKVIALLALLILISCAEQAPPQRPAIPQIEIKPPQAPALPEAPEYEPPPTYPFETGNTVEVVMTAENFKFTPNTINAKMGDKVRIIITAKDMAHTFTLPIFGVDRHIPAGQTTIIEFLADQIGQFTFYCNVPGHASKGMTGRIIVT